MTTQFATRLSLIALLAFMPWVFVVAAESADKSAKQSAPPTQSQGRSIVAVGAVEDTHRACLDRIPKEATAGQRMIAEDSCKRDQTSRQSAHEMPGY